MIESPNNGWLVYVRNSFAPQYGCGKPVIYLYPTRTINVSVRVGADVTVSDPSYPVGGWREVTVEPSGQLNLSRQTVRFTLLGRDRIWTIPRDYQWGDCCTVPVP